ncbi:RdgB/HAM1 family non-canonical purine NTP pyrophosphatase [Blastococcus montanus]|uniref:RdgB/HAM1 family non-canonical purine NTP pyrophosphatase n=1 Tax=Blastococcus montanus TaxID=3144973 RepID=UPI0032090645
MSTRLLLATRNAGKLAELQRLLESAVPGVEVLGLRDVAEYPEAPETGATFAENALLKAREAVRHTGLPAVADDSGLTVDALNGMPGVLSARWSGRHGDDDANTALLLGQLADVPDERRGAAFVCAAALVTPDGTERVLEREWRGTVVREKRGSNGFGYDPVFVPAGLERTSAELSPAEKDARSHRGQAFAALVPVLAEVLGAR